MAFTIGSGTFTNGSATVTGVTLTSGTLAYFASGTRMVVGVNPVIQEVEAIAAPTVSTITLRSAWTGTGGTYSFLANQTSEGLRDAVQAIRTNNASLQSFIDSIDTAATADSVAQRTSDGSINAVNVYASGNVGIGAASPNQLLDVQGGSSPSIKVRNTAVSTGNFSQVLLESANSFSGTSTSFIRSISINGGNSSTALTFGTNADGGGAPAERMRIDSSGNVGIGTSSPSGAKLNVVDSENGHNVFVDKSGGFGSALQLRNTSASSNDLIRVIDASNNVISAIQPATGGINFAFGNVGIGTSSPSAKLDVTGSGEQSIRLTSVIDGSNAAPKGSSLVFRSGTSSTVTASIASFNRFANSNGGDLVFSTGADLSGSPNTERMRIDSSGNVLAGVTSGVNHSFHKSSNAGQVFQIQNDSSTNGSNCLDLAKLTNNDASGSFLRCFDSGAFRLFIYGNGNVQNTNNSYGAISDAKLKENIEPASPKLDKLMQVDIVNYNLIGEELKQIGVVAQQLEKVFPSIVDESDDYEEVETTTVDEEGNETTEKTKVPTGTKTKSVKYSVFVPILIKAMQEQQEIIKALEARIEALEG